MLERCSGVHTEPRYAEVEVMTKTVERCVLELSGYLESSFRCFRVEAGRRVFRPEKSYYWGRSVLPKVVDVLSTREHYQVNSNLTATAVCVVTSFLRNTCRAQPHINLMREIDDEHWEDVCTTDLPISAAEFVLKRPFQDS
jgi:hypothetical protein